MKGPVTELQQLRARHRAVVLSGHVQVSELWGRNCLAYNVIVRPTEPARDGLHAIARQLAAAESQLLCVPDEALHVSVAWLLAVHRRYPRPKADLWAERGAAWLSGLRRVAESNKPFEICFRSLMATDSAIIAIAEPSGPVNNIRKQIATDLDLPPESHGTATLVHSTLCRYRGSPGDPISLLKSLDRCSIAERSLVNTLEVSKELVYPSLQTRCIARLPLTARQ